MRSRKEPGGIGTETGRGPGTGAGAGKEERGQGRGQGEGEEEQRKSRRGGDEAGRITLIANPSRDTKKFPKFISRWTMPHK
jgi:hypothetical protein